MSAEMTRSGTNIRGKAPTVGVIPGDDDLSSEEEYILSESEDDFEYDSDEEEPECITLDEDENVPTEGRTKDVTIPHLDPEFTNFLHGEVGGTERADGKYASDALDDFDRFCQALLLGDSDLFPTPPQSTAPLPSVAAPSLQSDGVDLESLFTESHTEDDGNRKKRHRYLTDLMLDQKASQLISLQHAKVTLLNAQQQAAAPKPLALQSERKSKPVETVTSRRSSRRVFRKDDDNPYIKPRLPFLRTENRVKDKCEWKAEKMEKIMNGMNRRFAKLISIERNKSGLWGSTLQRERVRSPIREEIGEEAKFDFTVTPDHTYAQSQYVCILSEYEDDCDFTPTPDHSYAKSRESETPTESGSIISRTSDEKPQLKVEKSVTEDTTRVEKTFLESSLLPACEDWTFLLSPQSAVSADLDPGESNLTHPTILATTAIHSAQHIDKSEISARSKEEEIFTVPQQATSYRVDAPFCTISSSLSSSPGTHNLSLETDKELEKVLADKAFRTARMDLNKKEQGRPRKFLMNQLNGRHEHDSLPAKKPKYAESKVVKNKSRLPLRAQKAGQLSSIELAAFIEARTAAHKLGIPEANLPKLSLPHVEDPNLTVQDMNEMTLKYLRGATEHMKSLLDWWKTDDGEISKRSTSGGSAPLPETGVTVDEVSKAHDDNKSESGEENMNFNFNLSNSDSEDPDPIKFSQRKGKTDLDFDFSEEMSGGGSLAGSGLKKMITSMVLAEDEEDLLSEIESVTPNFSPKIKKKIIRKRMSMKRPFLNEEVISDDESIRTDGSIASIQLGKLVKQMLYGENFLSDIESISTKRHSKTKNKLRQNKKMKRRKKIQHPIHDSDESSSSLEGSVSSSVVESILNDARDPEFEQLSGIQTLKSSGSVRSSELKGMINDYMISDEELLSDLEISPDARPVEKVPTKVGESTTPQEENARAVSIVVKESENNASTDVPVGIENHGMDLMSGDEKVKVEAIPEGEIFLELLLDQLNAPTIQHPLELGSSVECLTDASWVAVTELSIDSRNDCALACFGQRKVKDMVTFNKDFVKLFSSLTSSVESVRKEQVCKELSLTPERYDELAVQYWAEAGKLGRVLDPVDASAVDDVVKEAVKQRKSVQQIHSSAFLYEKKGPLHRRIVKNRKLDLGSARDPFGENKKTQRDIAAPEAAVSHTDTASESCGNMILDVSYFHHGDSLENLKKNRHTKSKWKIPTCRMEFMDTEMVSDLRMALNCVKDCVAPYERVISHKPLKLKELAYHKNPGWFLIIGDTVFCDERIPDSKEQVSRFIAYEWNAGIIETKRYQTKDASKFLLGDLKVRFGFPYRLFHQSGCMHSIVFHSTRLAEPGETKGCIFPRYSQVGVFPQRIVCDMDSKNTATWVLTNTPTSFASTDFTYYCKSCAAEVFNCFGQTASETRWRSAFRIQFGSNGVGYRVPDADIGWKSMGDPVLPKKVKTSAQNTGVGSCERANDNLRLYVKYPESEPPVKLFRLIQPTALLPALISKLPKKQLQESQTKATKKARFS